MNPIAITPVKNSLETVKKTISAVHQSSLPVEYYVFNDFSEPETEQYLATHADRYGYTLINLRDHVTTPSPNYRTVLIMAQQMALEKGADLIIVESDVIVEPKTLGGLLHQKQQQPGAGMIGAVTTDAQGNINFPYNHISPQDPDVINTKRSLSFCCTLLTLPFLKACNFKELRVDKDWYDVHLSKKSRALGFQNYLLKDHPVVHLPHSSRPWKMEKYTNPLTYYFKKFFLKRDRI